ncbi:DUF106 domain-containing protein [Candidatus Bathyarchaeota archaeon]|nr:DUF106 domain-containing protein [Candidatus Bathyarchaeota archaeon]
MKNKTLTFAISVLVISMFLCVAFVAVWAQVGTNIEPINPASGLVGSHVNVKGTIDTPNGTYLIYFGAQLVINNTSIDYAVNENFTVPDLPAGTYNITLQDTMSNQTAVQSFTITMIPTGFSAIPWSTFAIMGISVVIAFLNSGLNRLLITHFVGWEQYRSMQKETSEWRSQQMAAARANDKKQLEKLKKKESQIMAMQKKMAKPQMVLFGVSFIYIVVWIFFLTPTYGASPVAYLPGFGNTLGFGPHGEMGVFYWYPICSLLFGTLASRILGVLPME